MHDRAAQAAAALLAVFAAAPARAAIELAPLPASAAETRFDPFVDRDGDAIGQSSIRTASGATVRVYRENDAVTQVTFSRGDRAYALLRGGELAVVDYVFERASRNHFKLYAFPGRAPTRVTIHADGRLEVRFPNGDRMVRAGPELALVACQSDFLERDGHRTYREGTRSLPRIVHTGPRPFLLAVWYEYPPSGGAFELYVRGRRVGRLPAGALYAPTDGGDVVRTFGDLSAALRERLAGQAAPGVREFLAALD